MNKTLMWVLIAAVVVVGGYYVLKSDEKPSENKTTQEQTGKKMAFSEFAKNGGSYKCEVHQTLSDFENTGTVYMSGGNMRGEFSSVAEGRTIDSTFIFKDGFMYSWSSALPTMGFKLKANPTASNAEAAASGTYSWNTSEIGDYDCVAWEVDSSKFSLPSTVTFRELEGK